MSGADYLPSELAQFSSHVQHVKKRAAAEWSSSCPKCGGTPHPDGELPDRCRWFTAGTPPKPRGWCRLCGQIFWPDAAGGWKATPAELEVWRREREAAERRRKDEAEQALEHLRREKVWLEYVGLMDSAARAWWEARGVPADWQTHLQLGYSPNYHYMADGQERTSPAHAIPYFHTGWAFQTIQFRLDTTAADRYRFKAGTHAAYYNTEPEDPIGEQVIICEGATKGIVTRVYAVEKGVTVLAVPSKAAWGGVVEAVAEAQRVYVLLDPDGQQEAYKLARAIGDRAKVVKLFGKVDDLIVHHDLSRRDLAAHLRQAL